MLDSSLHPVRPNTTRTGTALYRVAAVQKLAEVRAQGEEVRLDKPPLLVQYFAKHREAEAARKAAADAAAARAKATTDGAALSAARDEMARAEQRKGRADESWDFGAFYGQKEGYQTSPAVRSSVSEHECLKYRMRDEQPLLKYEHNALALEILRRMRVNAAAAALEVATAVPTGASLADDSQPNPVRPRPSPCMKRGPFTIAFVAAAACP